MAAASTSWPAGCSTVSVKFSAVFAACLTVCGLSQSIHAQDVVDPAINRPVQFEARDTTPDADPGAATQTPPAGHKDRLFGVLPNYSTVEGVDHVPPVSAGDKFRMAGLTSFDPYVFPFVGVVARMSGAQGSMSYPRRYTTSLADNAIGNFLTSAVLPSALHQDPRYFELGHGSLWHRAGYALSRAVITRGGSGTSQFNASEVGGNLLAAGVSNLYYPAADRSVANTLTRWGTQVLWDTLSNELKEFWPDIRREIRKQ